MSKIQIEDETDTIKEMELEALRLSNELNTFTEEARRIKAEETEEVETEYEATGDKSLSNQTKRNVKVDAQLAKNEYYTTLVTDIREIGIILKGLAIDISFEKRQFSREMNHIEDVHEIRSSLVSIARDMRGLAAHPLG